ncbi:MAG: hypothetical protein K2X43_08055 [Hyphomonadaceae bacterium]|nr:hypothetical protein [Hyphomonadaceae bacterium]
MADLNALLAGANVRRALIVDDAYDAVPLASDLSELEADEWTQFFEDATENDLVILRELFPDYDNIRADILQTRDDFVASLWNNRARLRPELIDPLFARYSTDAAADRAFLDTLQERLSSFGLTCNTAGRQFREQAGNADIIVIDLFLGSAQNNDAINVSIEELLRVIDARSARPPLVVLMSRSPRLEEKRKDFRDRSGLFESAFRIIRKAEISEHGKLERLLIRLTSHYAESLKLAAFLHAWKAGLKEASNRTAALIRTLDLSDHAQIRQLLLSAEGEPTGSYLVDVFDRVLQHEIEREAAIIDAAIALNSLTIDKYPPPYVAGSRDLQELVHRCLFQNRERLRLTGAEGSRIAFGDVVRRRVAVPQAGQGQPAPILPDISPQHVLAVLTPACDLQRRGSKRVLLLIGSLQQLGPTDWTYGEDPMRTPVIELSNGERFWIKWDLKHVEALGHAELDRMLAPAGEFQIVARLRESHALELQQRLLSNLGRIGQIAAMPATFAMRVEGYLPGADRRPARIAGLADMAGVCYVGRSGPKDMRLILPEDECEAICKAVETIDLNAVHENARPAIEYLRQSGELMDALIKGITLPGYNADSFKEVPSPSGALEGNPPHQKVRTIGWISRNKGMNGVTLQNAQVHKSGILLATWDTSQHPEVQK